MKTLQFEATVTALSSITHNGGETAGITSKFRREKYIQPSGEAEEIPVVSGNGMRGMLRDKGMAAMCRALGYGTDEHGGIKGLTLPAFNFLFSGGNLGEGAKGLDIDFARRLRTLIPLVGLFGGGTGNQLLPGKLKCHKLIPICAETNHLLPAKFQRENAATFWNLLQEEMFVRKDDEKNETLRSLIGEVQQKALAAGAADLNGATLSTAIEKTDRPQQMMYFIETLAAGTQFYWKIVLEDVTDIEYEAFMTCLAEFSKTPYIGGKSGTGHGEVSVKFDDWIEIDSRIVSNGTAIGRSVGTAYNEHLSAHGDEIRAVLTEIK